MEANVKRQVDELLARDEPPELAGMPRGLEENGAVRKLSGLVVKYWDAYRDAQVQLIELEDQREEIARGAKEIQRLEKRTKRFLYVTQAAAVVTMALALGNCLG